MHVLSTQLECHTVQSIQLISFAQRFLDEVTADTDASDIHSSRQNLRRFQKLVMDIYHDVLIESADIDDDFLNDDDPNVVDTYKVYKEFKTLMPRMEIVSMVPMTLGGTVAFVCYDTNPIIPLGQRRLNPNQ